jgi:hypothetical protein
LKYFIDFNDENNQVFDEFPEDIHQKMKKLWKNKTFKNYFFKKKEKTHLSDGIVLLLDKLSILSSISSYNMDITDILCLEKKTIGATNINFQFKNINLNVIDSGGQRGQRRVNMT